MARTAITSRPNYRLPSGTAPANSPRAPLYVPRRSPYKITKPLFRRLAAQPAIATVDGFIKGSLRLPAGVSALSVAGYAAAAGLSVGATAALVAPIVSSIGNDLGDMYDLLAGPRDAATMGQIILPRPGWALINSCAPLGGTYSGPRRRGGWNNVSCPSTFLVAPGNVLWDMPTYLVGSVRYLTKVETTPSLGNLRTHQLERWRFTAFPGVADDPLPMVNASLTPVARAAVNPLPIPVKVPWRDLRTWRYVKGQLDPEAPSVPVASQPGQLPPDITVSDGVIGIGPPHRFNPPKKGEKEAKFKINGYVSGLLNAISETGDIIDAIWYSLPDSMRSPTTNPAQRARDIYNGYMSIDMNLAIKNLIIMQLTDAAIGRLSSSALRSLQRAGLVKRYGSFYGPAL